MEAPGQLCILKPECVCWERIEKRTRQRENIILAYGLWNMGNC